MDPRVEAEALRYHASELEEERDALRARVAELEAMLVPPAGHVTEDVKAVTADLTVEVECLTTALARSALKRLASAAQRAATLQAEVVELNRQLELQRLKSNALAAETIDQAASLDQRDAEITRFTAALADAHGDRDMLGRERDSFRELLAESERKRALLLNEDNDPHLPDCG